MSETFKEIATNFAIPTLAQNQQAALREENFEKVIKMGYNARLETLAKTPNVLTLNERWEKYTGSKDLSNFKLTKEVMRNLFDENDRVASRKQPDNRTIKAVFEQYELYDFTIPTNFMQIMQRMTYAQTITDVLLREATPVYCVYKGSFDTFLTTMNAHLAIVGMIVNFIPGWGQIAALVIAAVQLINEAINYFAKGREGIYKCAGSKLREIDIKGSDDKVFDWDYIYGVEYASENIEFMTASFTYPAYYSMLSETIIEFGEDPMKTRMTLFSCLVKTGASIDKYLKPDPNEVLISPYFNNMWQKYLLNYLIYKCKDIYNQMRPIKLARKYLPKSLDELIYFDKDGYILTQKPTYARFIDYTQGGKEIIESNPNDTESTLELVYIYKKVDVYKNTMIYAKALGQLKIFGLPDIIKEHSFPVSLKESYYNVSIDVAGFSISLSPAPPREFVENSAEFDYSLFNTDFVSDIQSHKDSYDNNSIKEPITQETLDTHNAHYDAMEEKYQPMLDKYEPTESKLNEIMNDPTKRDELITEAKATGHWNLDGIEIKHPLNVNLDGATDEVEGHGWCFGPDNDDLIMDEGNRYTERPNRLPQILRDIVQTHIMYQIYYNVLSSVAEDAYKRFEKRQRYENIKPKDRDSGLAGSASFNQNYAQGKVENNYQKYFSYDWENSPQENNRVDKNLPMAESTQDIYTTPKIDPIESIAKISPIPTNHEKE